jgi:ubiquinone/menaquinone biosynthesis C-methylase UbiE
MSIGRRKVSLEDEEAWVFNRMVQAYDARPEYPEELVAALSSAAPPAARVLDVGAGIGHLTLPLSRAGLHVTALEPAVHMLRHLEHRVRSAHLDVELVHGKAEELPFADHSFDLLLLADALHFLDSERAAREMARVARRRSSLGVVVCEFAATPFMTELQAIMHEAAPRRPRNTAQSLTELFAVSNLRVPAPLRWVQESPVDEATLFRILGSISFIGPAMNEVRAAAFRERVRAIPHPRRWAREVCLYLATRSK